MAALSGGDDGVVLLATLATSRAGGGRLGPWSASCSTWSQRSSRPGAHPEEGPEPSPKGSYHRQARSTPAPAWARPKTAARRSASATSRLSFVPERQAGHTHGAEGAGPQPGAVARTRRLGEVDHRADRLFDLARAGEGERRRRTVVGRQPRRGGIGGGRGEREVAGPSRRRSHTKVIGGEQKKEDGIVRRVRQARGARDLRGVNRLAVGVLAPRRIQQVPRQND